MYAKKLSEEDLKDLVKQSNLKSAVLLLKTKNEAFKQVDEDIDRIEIGSLLEKSQIEEIKQIMRLLSTKDQENFHRFLLQYEIKCVKSIFRKLFSDDKTSDIVVQNVKMWTNSLFYDIKGIETVRNFDEFFMAIKRMKYSDIFKKYQEKPNIPIFEVENELDKFYFEEMFDRATSNPKFKKIIGSEIDLLNVLWIYRIKKYYKFENTKIEEILIRRRYKLNNDRIKKLIECNSFDEIKDIMSKTVYKEVFTNEYDFEQNIHKYLYNVNKKIFREDITSNAFIYAYINLLDYENNDIINTIEGIRYNMDKNEILKRLVR